MTKNRNDRNPCSSRAFPADGENRRSRVSPSEVRRRKTLGTQSESSICKPSFVRRKKNVFVNFRLNGNYAWTFREYQTIFRHRRESRNEMKTKIVLTSGRKKSPPRSELRLDRRRCRQAAHQQCGRRWWSGAVLAMRTTGTARAAQMNRRSDGRSVCGRGRAVRTRASPPRRPQLAQPVARYAVAAAARDFFVDTSVPSPRV